jgi:hypothetical protein
LVMRQAWSEDRKMRSAEHDDPMGFVIAFMLFVGR